MHPSKRNFFLLAFGTLLLSGLILYGSFRVASSQLPAPKHTPTVAVTATKTFETCVSLMATESKESKTTYTFRAVSAFSNPVTPSGVIFDFGDGGTKTVSKLESNGTVATTTHPYQGPGRYLASAAALFSDGMRITSSQCHVVVDIKP